jgi:uncharacterized membrane protein HdeD (DUF308 family)
MPRLFEMLYWLVLSAWIIALLEVFVAIIIRTAKEQDRPALRAAYSWVRKITYAALFLDGLAILAFPRSQAVIMLMLIGIAACASPGIIRLGQILRQRSARSS